MSGHSKNQSIFPYLSIKGVDRAPDGTVLHAEVRIGRSAIFIAEAAAGFRQDAGSNRIECC